MAKGLGFGFTVRVRVRVRVRVLRVYGRGQEYWLQWRVQYAAQLCCI